MEHVEEAGVHSGDSACVIPPHVALRRRPSAVIEDYTRAIAEALDVEGLINVQYAVKADQVFVIEANPRASRTVPFVAKATGVPLVKVAARVDGRAPRWPSCGPRACCASRWSATTSRSRRRCCPFRPLPRRRRRARPRDALDRRGHGHRPHLRPGLRQEPDRGGGPPARVAARCSCRSPTATSPPASRRPADLRRARLRHRRHRRHRRPTSRRAGVEVATVVAKLGEAGGGIDAVDLIRAGEIDLVVNSPRGRGPRADGAYIRARRGARPRPPRSPPAPPALAAAEGMADWARHELARPHAAGVPPGRHRADSTLRLDVLTCSPTPVAGGGVGPAPPRIGSVSLPNPVMTASGTAGHGAELAAYLDLSELGAVVVKSLSADPWAGNPPPRVHETAAGMINSVGLQGPGVAAWLADDLPALQADRRPGRGAASGAAPSRLRAGRGAAGRRARRRGRRRGQPVVPEPRRRPPPVRPRRRRRRRGHRRPRPPAAGPRWAKLSPNVADLVEVAGAVPTAGAEAVTLVNTRAGHAADRRPAPGPASAAAAAGCRARPSTRSPCGPSTTCTPPTPTCPSSASAASPTRRRRRRACSPAERPAVQVGTATFADPRAPARVLDELETWCRRTRTATVRETDRRSP